MGMTTDRLEYLKARAIDQTLVIDEAGELIGEVVRLRKLVPEWHSVDDKLPEEGVTVQVWPRDTGYGDLGFYDKSGCVGRRWCADAGIWFPKAPTHWCPLTQGPEVTG